MKECSMCNKQHHGKYAECSQRCKVLAYLTAHDDCVLFEDLPRGLLSQRFDKARRHLCSILGLDINYETTCGNSKCVNLNHFRAPAPQTQTALERYLENPPTQEEINAVPHHKCYTSAERELIRSDFGGVDLMRGATDDEKAWLNAFNAAWLGNKNSPMYEVIAEQEGRTGRGQTLNQVLRKDAIAFAIGGNALDVHPSVVEGADAYVEFDEEE